MIEFKEIVCVNKGRKKKGKIVHGKEKVGLGKKIHYIN